MAIRTIPSVSNFPVKQELHCGFSDMPVEIIPKSLGNVGKEYYVLLMKFVWLDMRDFSVLP
jgi:hypothetical protein